MPIGDDDRFSGPRAESEASLRGEASFAAERETAANEPRHALHPPEESAPRAATPASPIPRPAFAARPMTAVRGTDRAIDPVDLPRAHFLARLAAWLVDMIVLGFMNAALVWVAASAVIAAERFIGHPLLDASDVV